MTWLWSDLQVTFGVLALIEAAVVCLYVLKPKERSR